MQPFCRETSLSVTYSECAFVDLGIQHAVRCAILSSAACPTLRYFSVFSHKRQDFRKKVIEFKICVLILSTTFVSHISHSKKK